MIEHEAYQDEQGNLVVGQKIRNRIDNMLCTKVAVLWVELGGDSLGMELCWRDIVERIKELE